MEGLHAGVAQLRVLQKGWTVHLSQSRKILYFSHEKKRITQWTAPDGLLHLSLPSFDATLATPIGQWFLLATALNFAPYCIEGETYETLAFTSLPREAQPWQGPLDQHQQHLTEGKAYSNIFSVNEGLCAQEALANEAFSLFRKAIDPRGGRVILLTQETEFFAPLVNALPCPVFGVDVAVPPASIIPCTDATLSSLALKHGLKVRERTNAVAFAEKLGFGSLLVNPSAKREWEVNYAPAAKELGIINLCDVPAAHWQALSHISLVILEPCSK